MSKFVVTKSWNDRQWPTMTYYDLHWPTMTTFLRSDKAEIWYRQKSSDGDQLGHYELSPLCHVTSYQTLFKNPLSWGRTNLKFGTDINKVTVTSLDTMNYHRYVTWLVTRPFLKIHFPEVGQSWNLVQTEIKWRWPAWTLWTVIILSRD